MLPRLDPNSWAGAVLPLSLWSSWAYRCALPHPTNKISFYSHCLFPSFVPRGNPCQSVYPSRYSL